MAETFQAASRALASAAAASFFRVSMDGPTNRRAWQSCRVVYGTPERRANSAVPISAWTFRTSSMAASMLDIKP